MCSRGIELRHLHFLLETYGRIISDVSFAAEDREQGLPVPLLRVDVFELRGRFVVAGLQTQDPFERLARLLQVPKTFEPKASDAHVERDLDPAVCGNLGLAIENLDKVVPSPRAFVELRQRAQRLRIVRGQS